MLQLADVGMQIIGVSLLIHAVHAGPKMEEPVINKLVALIAIPAMLFSFDLMAKREAPKEVKPVIHRSIKYTAPFGAAKDVQQNGGVVQAWDLKTNKLLWQVVAYKINYDPNLESDVQDVFIVSMAIKGNELIVTNEKGETYAIDLKTRAVREVKPAGH